MVYEYNEKVINNDTVDNFYSKNNFVGYILPNGDIFQCKNHNIYDSKSFLFMYLMLLDNNFDERRELFNATTNNMLSKWILKSLTKMSHEEIHAMLVLVMNDKYTISDLLVGYFGCHLITRLEKEILTSEINYECFYNYLLNDYKITNIGKFIYDEKEKEFKHIYPKIRNEYLYDEIKSIKSDANEKEIALFYKRK